MKFFASSQRRTCINSILFVLLFIHPDSISAQDSLSAFSFSGMSELYYAHDQHQSPDKLRPSFIYNHKAEDQLNFNMFMLHGAFAKEKFHANAGLMMGDYATYNLVSEPKWAQHIFELNAGVRLGKTHKLWLDGGVMPSHIGFESALCNDNWTLTRSILAENSPYFETGLRLSGSFAHDKVYVALLFLDGWQRISIREDQIIPALGTQLTWTITKNISFNYSNYAGDEFDTAHTMRYYNNFFLKIENVKRFSLIAGLDIGTKQYDMVRSDNWFSPVAIVKYSINEKNRLAARYEYYQDTHQAIIQTGSSEGLHVSGISVNFDRNMGDHLLWRAEIKYFHCTPSIFAGNSDSNFGFTTHLVIRI